MSDQLAEARALLLSEKKARADACWAELKSAMDAILEKHGCNLDVVPGFVPSGGGVFSVAVNLRVSARED